jgi:hypothetical protein
MNRKHLFTLCWILACQLAVKGVGFARVSLPAEVKATENH